MKSQFPVWTCRSDKLHCACGHQIKPKTPGAILTTKGDCLRPLTCAQCGGKAIGVHSEHHGITTFYGCGSVVFDQIVNWPDVYAKTWVLLTAMSFITEEAA